MLAIFSKRARLSLVLIFSILLLQMPVVLAEGEPEPVYITTCDQLQAIADNLVVNYTLANDIDCLVATSEGGSLYNDGAGFNPIGDNLAAYTGDFDGQGYTISNLFINRPAEPYVGLFGYIGENGTVIDLVISDADITGGNLTGGLVGISFGNFGYVSFSGSVSGNYGVGGLVGEAAGLVTRSSSTGTVTCADTYCGGLAGFNIGTISDSYSRATVNGTTFVGGLLGYNAAAGAEVLRSYSTGIPSGSINNTGGLIGVNEDGELGAAIVTDSFYDSETSGLSDEDKGTGKTTVEMKLVATFTDTDTVGLTTAWDFVGNPNEDGAINDYWDIDPDVNDGYPFLAWQTIVAPTNFTVTVADTTTIDMSWTDVANNDGYKVDVGAGADESVFPTVNEYTDEVPNLIAINWTGLTANTQYMARVGAYDSVGTRYTTSEPFYTFASVPTNLLATATTNNSLSFSWTGDGTSYIVYNSVFGTTSTENTSLSLSDLSCNTAYTFKVKALNGDNVETAYSSDLIITTSSCSNGSGGGGSGGSSGGSGSGVSSSSSSLSGSQTSVTSSPCSFTDTANHFAFDAVKKLCEIGVVSGRTQTFYEPNSFLTRAEMMKIALLLFDYNIIKDHSSLDKFKDADKSNWEKEWYVDILATAVKEEIIKGYDDDTLRPNANVSRAEALKILLLASRKELTIADNSPFIDVISTDWFKKLVDFAYSINIIQGKSPTIFGPNDFITRGEVAVIFINTFEQL